MLSKNQKKLIRSLQQKKGREQQHSFLAEGEKIVAEVLASQWQVSTLYATADFLAKYQPTLNHIIEVSEQELTAAGTLKSNNAAIAIVEKPALQTIEALSAEQWILALDNINDPGNLGSIMRIADWYGIKHIVCSPTTVDAYNPKVINASKGSFLRVQMHYHPLDVFLAAQPNSTPILGAYLDGASVHALEPALTHGVLVMGSEAHGISPALEKLITHPVTIPAYGAAESLNVGIATAIICDNLKRQSRQ